MFMPGESERSTRVRAGELRRGQTRARLISASARVLASRGAERATIDDFVREANVSRGTFYNYFTTREELLEALWATYGHDPFHKIQQNCQSIRGPAERLSAFTRHILHAAERDSAMGWIIMTMSSQRATLNDELATYPGPDLKAGRALGVFHFDDLTCAIDVVVGAVRSALGAILEENRAELYPQSVSKMILLSLGMARSDAHRISHGPLTEAKSTREVSLL